MILLSHFVDFDKYLSNEEKLLYLIEKILNSKAKEELLIKYGKKFDTSEFDNIKKNLRQEFIVYYKNLFFKK